MNRILPNTQPDESKSNGRLETGTALKSEVSNKRTRILIVEDEPAMVPGLRDNFEYEGYEVISALDGVGRT